MKTLKALSFEEANVESQAILSIVKDKIGMIPNLYSAMGVSDKLLGGFLNFTEILKSGEFSNKEYEVIALAASQGNDCAYCLSAHSSIAKMHGFSEDEILDLRTISISDQKLNALVSLVSEFVISRGHPGEIAIHNFFEAGYRRAAFAELIGIISLTTITNYVYHNGDFDIDFPEVQSIASPLAE